MVGLQTSHRYGNETMLNSDFVFGVGNRWANRHTGSVDVYTEAENSCMLILNQLKLVECSALI